MRLTIVMFYAPDVYGELEFDNGDTQDVYVMVEKKDGRVVIEGVYPYLVPQPGVDYDNPFNLKEITDLEDAEAYLNEDLVLLTALESLEDAWDDWDDERSMLIDALDNEFNKE